MLLIVESKCRPECEKCYPDKSAKKLFFVVLENDVKDDNDNVLERALKKALKQIHAKHPSETFHAWYRLGIKGRKSNTPDTAEYVCRIKNKEGDHPYYVSHVDDDDIVE